MALARAAAEWRVRSLNVQSFANTAWIPFDDHSLKLERHRED